MKIATAIVQGLLKTGEIDGDRFFETEGDVYVRAHRNGTAHHLEDIKLESPCQPRKLLCLLRGWNPIDGSAPDPPAAPKVVPKVPSHVTGDGADIVVPGYLTKPIWIEVELAVVIGRQIHRPSPSEARQAILGFTCFHDVTAFEYLADGDFFRAKSIETFASMGPCINTDITEADVMAGISLEARINDVPVRAANTRSLKYPPSRVVHEVAQFSALRPGDVISFGAPLPSPPPEGFPGDSVALEIDTIGILHNRVISAT